MKKLKLLFLLLHAFLLVIAVEACKTSEKSSNGNKEKTTNQTISKQDTIPNQDNILVNNKNDSDTIKVINSKNWIVKDTIDAEKISTINPKIHPDILPLDIEGNILEIDNSVPRYKITELSNFNPFLEKMYPGVKWKHFDNKNPEDPYNVYAASYKGTDFFYEYVNSFVYYFYDIGQISHADLIKTATFWILQPLYPDIEIYKTELYDQKDEDNYNHFDYYYTTGAINGQKLEVYTIIRNNQIEIFRALKNNVEIKSLGSFI